MQASPTTDCQFGRTINSANNRIDGAVTYDGAGNLTSFEGHTYSYDAVNMQTRDTVGGTIREYIYTADDERIAVYTATAGSWLWSVRDPSGKVLRDFTSQNGPSALGTANWAWVKDYVWRDGLLLATRQLDEAGTPPTTYHYHLDHLGTPRRITDNANQIIGAHAYHAFGPELEADRINEPSPTRMKYTGHERDSDTTTGAAATDYMHARYYYPAMGRFLSVDPAMDLEANLPEPQRWNKYAYATNNPLKYTDPDGRERLAYWHFNRQPVPDRGFKTELVETSKTAAMFGGMLVGPALAAEGAFEAGLLLMRNPGAVLGAMKLLDAMGGNTSSHVNTTGLTGGKHGYLLDNATKTGFFRGVMGLTEKTIGSVLQSHFAENFSKSGKFNAKGLFEVTGRMVDAKGRAWSVTTTWQWVKKTKPGIS